MAEYEINKGIGREVEFMGLRAQYLMLFAGGLLGVFILFMIMYMSGVAAIVTIPLGITLAAFLVLVTFRMNARYGSHGLMKAMASRSRPRRIIHRKSIARLVRRRDNNTDLKI